jgi:RHS repeat-associated protein
VKQRYTYTGREVNPAGAGMYYRWRAYDPRVGRFGERDPIAYVAGTGLYAYVGAAPLRLRDAFGLLPPDHKYCKDLRKKIGDIKRKIRNLRNKINERTQELNENPQNLPDTHVMDDILPKLSRRGHQRLINMDKLAYAARRAQLAVLIFKHTLMCYECKPRRRPIPADDPKRTPVRQPPPKSERSWIMECLDAFLLGAGRPVPVAPTSHTLKVTPETAVVATGIVTTLAAPEVLPALAPVLRPALGY